MWSKKNMPIPMKRATINNAHRSLARKVRWIGFLNRLPFIPLLLLVVVETILPLLPVAVTELLGIMV